jgi:hypothetical protein
MEVGGLQGVVSAPLPKCGGEMKFIAFSNDKDEVQRVALMVEWAEVSGGTQGKIRKELTSLSEAAILAKGALECLSVKAH